MGGVVYRDTVVLAVGRLVAEYQCTYPVSLSLALPAVAFWSRRERPLKGCRLFYLMACLCRCCEACSRYLFRLGNFETREDASENGINFAPFPRRPFFPLFLRRVFFRVFFLLLLFFLFLLILDGRRTLVNANHQTGASRDIAVDLGQISGNVSTVSTARLRTRREWWP